MARLMHRNPMAGLLIVGMATVAVGLALQEADLAGVGLMATLMGLYLAVDRLVTR